MLCTLGKFAFYRLNKVNHIYYSDVATNFFFLELNGDDVIRLIIYMFNIINIYCIYSYIAAVFILQICFFGVLSRRFRIRC